MNVPPARAFGWTAVALVALSLSPVAQAGKDDAVLRLVADNKHDAAQARCERWEAWDPGEDPAVRDACAQAFWVAAEAVDSSSGWAAFREQWSGTKVAADARVREAAAALRELPDDADEALLMNLYGLYRGTPSAAAFEARGAAAAIRDARTPDAATQAARRWAGHPDLPKLVERFPGAFLTMERSGRRVSWTVNPPVELTGDYAPQARWVARTADGTTEPWDRAARDLLVRWGLPERAASSLPVSDGEPSLPVCFVPGQPAGWRPGVEVTIGEGRLFSPVSWDEGCGPDAWPVFLSLQAGRVVGLSLRPGHKLDLRQSALGSNRRLVSGFLGNPPGTPTLWNGAVYQRAGAAWLVSPLSGGVPWATRAGPEPAAVPLTDGLKGGFVPEGWMVDGRKQPPQVRGPALERMPEALRTWTLVPGEVRSPPPLLREVLGLTADRAQPPRPIAPALPRDGWQRTGNGAVVRTPPAGATVAGLYALEAPALDQALRAVAAVGLPATEVEISDGWSADLDGDGVSEQVLRATMSGDGVVIVVDPLTAEDSDPSRARVFVVETPRVRADARPADTPFTFRKGNFVYLTWAGQEVLGPTARRTFVQVVRSDGSGFTVDDLTLP